MARRLRDEDEDLSGVVTGFKSSSARTVVQVAEQLGGVSILPSNGDASPHPT